MPQEMNLKAEKRETSGQNAARRLRRQDKIPAVLYGGADENIPLSVERTDLMQILRSDRGVNTLLTIEVGNGDSCKALIREIQLEPVRDDVLHADFVRVSLTEEIELPVHFEFVGEAAGVRTQGGVLHVVRHEVDVACLPTAIPENIPVDVTELEIGDEIRIVDVPVPEGIRILEEPERLVVHVVPPTLVAAEKDEEEEEELLEGEEAEAAEEGEEGAEPSESDEESSDEG